jgi:hypothetical protein
MWKVEASPYTTPAAASDTLDWDNLRPAAAAADNPFERLTPQQTDWITEIALGRLMQGRSRPFGVEASARQAALSAALAAEGLDAEELLRQRDAVIAQRRTAAQAPVPAVAGREVRLVGYLLPASADGVTVTDWLFVPWAAACSHTPPPANQTVRIPAQDLADADRHGSQPLVLTGRIDVLEQESRLRLVDLGAGCAAELGEEAAVVRGAILARDGRSAWEHRVERTSRADLGIWVREVAGRGGTLAPQAGPGRRRGRSEKRGQQRQPGFSVKMEPQGGIRQERPQVDEHRAGNFER